jgi:hypothetical protein
MPPVAAAPRHLLPSGHTALNQGAAVLAASLPKQQRRQQHSKQPRLTPAAGANSKALPVQVVGEIDLPRELQLDSVDNRQSSDAREVELAAGSPAAAAAPSQQLGLSSSLQGPCPDLSSSTYLAQQAGVAAVEVASGGETGPAPDALLPAASTAAEVHQQQQAASAREWSQLLRHAQMVVDSISRADPQHPSHLPDDFVPALERETHYARVVSTSLCCADVLRLCCALQNQQLWLRSCCV